MKYALDNHRGRLLHLAAALFICLLTAGCEHRISPLGSGKSDYGISYNPYARVDWTSWQRCLAQQHDHLNARFERILAYDEAGYQAVAMLGYGGNPRYAHAYNERLWPPGRVTAGFSDDGQLLAQLEHIRFFIPAMEEVGDEHLVSSFFDRIYRGVSPGARSTHAYQSISHDRAGNPADQTTGCCSGRRASHP